MAIPFKATQNVLNPSYDVTLIDGDGSVANLTSATEIRFIMTQVGASTPKVDALTGATDAANGKVTYQWTGTDLDTPGLYTAKWEVTFPGPIVVTYPSDNVDLVEVVTGPNLGYLLSGATAPWTTVQEVRMCCKSVSAITGTENYVSDDQVQAEINVATGLLYTLTAQQFPGEGATIIRPCAAQTCLPPRPFNFITSFPITSDPSSWDFPECGCGRLQKVDLGLWPVTNVVYVKVDGAVVDPSTYRLDQNRYLVHLANPDFSNDGWPRCQYLDRPTTEVGTWEVMVEYGMPVPLEGRNAANRLACELVKACAGIPCNLPGRVSSVNRQQLSFTMINPSMLDNGLTGIYDVDLFIMAYNPAKARGQTVVWSPDLAQHSWR